MSSSALPDFLQPLAGVRLAGRYLLDNTLGEGGMGVVVGAAYPELDQRVAIKFMRPELAANVSISARFLREARLAARVKSPHFVRVYDVGRTEGAVVVPYIVMEMLAGRDLGDELRARGALPIEEAVDYVLQACAGIAEIHSFGVVHRDLKPSNLFLAETAGSRLVKVLDFGVSKDKENAPINTATNGPVGTPHYMSPEQVRESKSVDGRSDVWAIGVVLYELLTQTLPFLPAEGGAGEVFGMILFAQPEKPSTYRMEMPAGLEEVILKCLERDRELRYASIGEFAEALRPFAAPQSLHRISMIRQALAHRPASTSDLNALANEQSHAATLPLTPDTQKSPSPATSAAISEPSDADTTLNNSEPRSVRAAANQGNHATSFTSMTDTRVPGIAASRARRRTVGLFLAGGAAFLLAAVIFMATRHDDPIPTTTTSAPATSPTPVSSQLLSVPIAPTLPSSAELTTAPTDAGVQMNIVAEDAATHTTNPIGSATTSKDPVGKKPHPKPPAALPDDLLDDRK